MAEYNPFDDLILGDDADPAYSVVDIPTIPTSRKVDEPRTTEQIQKELQDIALTQEYGKFFKPFYKAITPEEELEQQIEQKKLLNQQLLQEAQPMIQQIQQLPQDSREQLLAIRALEQDLVSKGYEGSSMAEVLGSVGQTFYGDERAAIEKAARGELLTPGEFGLIGMAPISALDFAFPGIAAKLATRGFTKIDDVLKSSLDIPEVQQVKQTFGGAGYIPSGVVRQAEKGEGLTPSTAGTRTQTKRSGALVEPSPKAGYKLTDNSKIANAQADLWDEGKKFETRDDFVKAVEKKSGVKNLNTEKLRNARDYYIRKGQLSFGTKKLEYRRGQDDDGLYPFPEPSLTPETKKLIKYIEKNKDKIEPGSLKRLADQYGASYDRIKREFPELSIGQRPSRFTLEASTAARREGTKNKIEEMLKQKKILQEKYPRVDFDKYNVLKRFLDERGLVSLDEKRIREAYDQGIIDEKLLKEIYPGTGKRPGIPEGASLDPIQRILDDTNQSVYDKATEIVEKFFGRNIDTGTQKLLVNTIRKNPQREVDKLRQQGALTRDEFDMQDEIRTLSKPERNKARKKYIQSLLGEQSEAEYLVEPNIMSKRLQDDIKEGMGFDTGLFKMNAEAAKEANLVMRDYFKDLFINKTSDPKLLKFRENFIKQYDKGRTKKTDLTNIDGQNDFLRALKQTYGAQLSHTMPASKKQGAEIADRAENIKINSAAHNVQLQSKVEKRIATQLSNIRKALTEGDMEKVNQYVNTIKIFDDMFKKRNMAGSYYVNNDRVVDVLKDKGLNADRNLLFIGTEKSLRDINDPVREANYMLDYIKKYFDRLIDNPEKIEFYQSQLGKPTRKQQKRGLEQEIRKGMPVSEYAKDPFAFAKGGPVNMALGGDPLANMNQQQYSPDPAFDDDYFQQAVESGNLQAANLFNLFKVFKKPKVMATPSNVKQVQQANEALPQAVPGSQEIAPMQAGRPDFFFKSYLLDQLNSPNAPKASNPQGWREFLIKGKKVPEAEMADTGILQYLEDTEKFYPDKKITREEIENLYDMSPLGNLEVRVKPVRGYPEGENVPQESFEFFADQGTQKHRGVGNAEIDNAAEEYFEVVVNVPNLPGQERAYVNSAHFSEPNVLGFTRVGTYKNNAGEKVAVIQEMQTDMLTEVRKEQERLFAMVNNLKRQRAQKVENINRADPSYRQYEENELRLFDQKYPPELLDALETENLIQPFPNIVAKDLIPERTRSLNQIQEDINQLMMANVEQYADPAYKTKIFDLAQEQQKILDDLVSMNRSDNYKEKLKGFKVPSTGERAELENIAYTQNYSPSSYQTKEVQSFPPIPFNKQADYVDLLVKSTIKAAKQKGIDKVAIMPADVGANPRWRKDTDEAKKKFRNLYDKVGVQQLKNIAKKYGGKLEIEKIVDPNKNTRGLTFLNKNPDGEFQILKQTEARSTISNAERDAFYDEEIKRIVDNMEGESLYTDEFQTSDIVYSREVAPGQIMDYYLVPGRGDATDVGYRMIPLKEGQSADDAMIKIVEYNPSEVDMYTISFDPSKLEEPMYLFKKKSGGSIDKDSLVSITDIYGEYGR